MTNQHPITPPPELVEQWAKHVLTPEEGTLVLDLDWFATQAAQWGADQELEACVEWFDNQSLVYHRDLEYALRTARRPNPPSLKAKALEALEHILHNSSTELGAETIRRALEALDD